MNNSRPLPTADSDFENHLSFVRGLLGVHFDRCWRKFEHLLASGFVYPIRSPLEDEIRGEAQFGRAKSSNSMPHYHRLMYLYDRLLWSQSGMKRNPKECDAIAVVEIEFVKQLFAKWKDHPIGNEIQADIVAPRGYVHALCLLARCQQNREDASTKFAIDPVPARSTSGSIADARISDSRGGKLIYELKAPDSLLQPDIQLTQNQANSLVERAFKNAKHQIGIEPSALAIGGLYLNHLTKARVVEGFKDHFRRKKPKQIAFGELCSIGIYARNISVTDTGFAYHPHSSIEPRVELQLIGNPHYEGEQLVTLVSADPSNEVLSELAIYADKPPNIERIR